MNHHFRTWPPTPEDIDLLHQIGTGESTNLEFKQEMPDGDAFRKEVCDLNPNVACALDLVSSPGG